MHCQLLLRVMRHNGLGAMLDDPKHGVHFRKLLWESVIATDMGVHKNFMERFKDLVDGEAGTLSLRQILVCQALLKNADISNPVRRHTHFDYDVPTVCSRLDLSTYPNTGQML